MNLLNLFKDSDNLINYHAGSTIFSEGDPGDQMYVVIDGEVEARIGHEVIDVFGPGNIVGEMALIDEKARSASAVAKTDCRLAAVDEKSFLFMVQQTPNFSLLLMRILVDRLRRTNARLSHT